MTISPDPRSSDPRWPIPPAGAPRRSRRRAAVTLIAVAAAVLALLTVLATVVLAPPPVPAPEPPPAPAPAPVDGGDGHTAATDGFLELHVGGGRGQGREQNPEDCERLHRCAL